MASLCSPPSPGLTLQLCYSGSTDFATTFSNSQVPCFIETIVEKCHFEQDAFSRKGLPQLNREAGIRGLESGERFQNAELGILPSGKVLLR